MNLVEAIRSRRSVRSYEARSVEEGTIRALLEAAVQAPSAMNVQPWVFAVVQDVAQLARLSERAKALLVDGVASDPKTKHYAGLLRDPGFNIFYDASTLIVIGTRERGPFTEADGWLAAENLMLASCDAGLGSCCIGFALPLLNTTEVLAELALPAAGAAVAAIIVGHPRAIPPAVPRNAPVIASWSRGR